jgi:hypothetical protein
MRALILAGLVALVVLLTVALVTALNREPTPGTSDNVAEATRESTTQRTSSPVETTQALSDGLNELTSVLSDVLLLGALGVAGVIGYRIVVRVVRLLSAPPQLVVEQFANSSGSDDMGKAQITTLH